MENNLIEKKDIELLERIRTYIYSNSVGGFTAIHKSESQRLREAADLIEARERDSHALDKLIVRLKFPNL